jgi:1,4-dihydroxy-2-naphthoate octaprenyltransferase
MNSSLRAALKLLRLPFSFLLLPVFLLAVSQLPVLSPGRMLVVALILHVLVYPASNGYNSWVDRDTTPIGGLKAPPPPPPLLLPLTVILDLLALLGAWLLEPLFALGILLYILASRAYSWERIRLKRRPVIGFFTIFIFQGLLTYLNTLIGCVSPDDWPGLFTFHQAALALAAACLIGGVYPLTQIYQHQADAERGDQTLSQLLGYRGTFVFAATLFGLAGGILAVHLPLRHFLLFSLCLLPVAFYFIFWAHRVWHNPEEASFEHTMRLNVMAAICLNLCFGLIGLGRLL